MVLPFFPLVSPSFEDSECLSYSHGIQLNNSLDQNTVFHLKMGSCGQQLWVLLWLAMYRTVQKLLADTQME